MPTSGPETALPADAAALTGFVRGTLGCGCPDEVFERIVVSRLDRDRVRLAIGGRLLVDVVADADCGSPSERLPDWVRDGLGARDRCGMNRFRLVLGSSAPQRLQQGVAPLFAALTAGDDRAHLHCLERAALPAMEAAA